MSIETTYQRGSPHIGAVGAQAGAAQQQTARPPRADAVRNRARVLTAAREAFAQHGSDAQMEDVARRAQVGVGTVYRHFQTKDVLIDALLTQCFTQLVAEVSNALEIPDAWEAINTAFRASAELQARDRCLADVLGERKQTFTATAPIMNDLREVWRQLLDRGQSQGVIRPDVSVADLSSLMCGLANVVNSAPQRGAWERYLSLLLDGLRAAPTLTPLVALTSS
jgi:AcrR family transcriptional regulator